MTTETPTQSERENKVHYPTRTFRKHPFCYQEKCVTRALREKYRGNKLSKMLSLYLALTEIDSDFNGKPVEYYTNTIATYSGLSVEWIPTGLKELMSLGAIKISTKRGERGRFGESKLFFTPDHIKISHDSHEEELRGGRNLSDAQIVDNKNKVDPSGDSTDTVFTDTGKTVLGESGHGKTGTLEVKSILENKSDKNLKAHKMRLDEIPIPDSLNNEKFFEAWKRWIDYKRATTRISIIEAQETLIWLADRSKNAVEHIEQAIRGGWKGCCYELKNKAAIKINAVSGENTNSFLQRINAKKNVGPVDAPEGL